MRLRKIIYCAAAFIAYGVMLLAFWEAVCFGGAGIIPGVQPEMLLPAAAVVANNGSLLLAFMAQQFSIPLFLRAQLPVIPTVLQRSCWVGISSLLLIVLMRQWQSSTYFIWTINSSEPLVLLTFLYFIGWSVLFFSSFLLGHGQLTGIRPVWLFVTGRSLDDGGIRLSIQHPLVREPFYLGILLILWATPQMTIIRLMLAIGTLLVATKSLFLRNQRELNYWIHGEPITKSSVPADFAD